MPETAWTTVPTTSPSSATWPSISSARSPPKAPCASRSSGQDGRTRSSPKSSPKSEMRLPCTYLCLSSSAIITHSGDIAAFGQNDKWSFALLPALPHSSAILLHILRFYPISGSLQGFEDKVLLGDTAISGIHGQFPK